MEPVVAATVETPVVPKEEEQTAAEENYESLTRSIASAKRLVEAFSTRLFKPATNYKKVQGFEDGAPGKKNFISMAAKIGALQKDVDKMHRTHTKKPRPPGSNEKTGFKRLVLVSEELSKFMGLAEWDVMSEAHPDRGVITHAVVTRFISNYTALMCLKTGSTSAWTADPALEQLFSKTKITDESGKVAVVDVWEKEGVNRKSASCPDLQKLLKYHMEKLLPMSTEMRKEAFYRDKSADTGEFGSATKKIFDLRHRLASAEAQIEKNNRMWTNCCKKRPGQGVTIEYERIVKENVEEFKKVGAEIRTSCDNYGFTYAPQYPALPKVHDGLK
uniref:Uncharacterized protein n=1 Tax=viral metagenome TaxID=1070528 RepID=A0A6C0CH24_9ZZZZ